MENASHCFATYHLEVAVPSKVTTGTTDKFPSPLPSWAPIHATPWSRLMLQSNEAYRVLHIGGNLNGVGVGPRNGGSKIKSIQTGTAEAFEHNGPLADPSHSQHWANLHARIDSDNTFHIRHEICQTPTSSLCSLHTIPLGYFEDRSGLQLRG